MQYSVTEAARIAGKSRMTIIRAIAAGTLSATREEPGKPWTIDASELARVFPGADHVPNHVPNIVLPRSGDDRPQNGGDPSHQDKDALILEQRQTIDDLRRRLDQEAADRRQALDRLAAAQERIAALLTDQRAPALPTVLVRRAWWPWRRG
jgi:hypothetical protein